MGLMDQLKNLSHSGLTEKLGLDSKVGEALEGLAAQLEELAKEGKLDDIAKNALASFRPGLEKFQSSKDLGGLLEKGKAFIEGLSKAELPDELRGVIDKIKGML